MKRKSNYVFLVVVLELAVHSLAAASRPRLLETEPRLLCLKLPHAFGWRYCIESVASQK